MEGIDGLKMEKVTHVKVTLAEVRGDFGKMLRRFIKKTKKQRIVQEVLDRRFFEKPSKKRRLERVKKKRNAQKAERERNKKLDIR